MKKPLAKAKPLAKKPVAKAKPVSKKVVKPAFKKVTPKAAPKKVVAKAKPVAKKVVKPISKKGIATPTSKVVKKAAVPEKKSKQSKAIVEKVVKVKALKEKPIKKEKPAKAVKPPKPEKPPKKIKAPKKPAAPKIDYVELRRKQEEKARIELEAYLAANPKRKLLKLEYVVRSSPTILYSFIKSSSCLALWFCDICIENGNDYLFGWNGDVQYATLIMDHDNEYVRYRWNDGKKEEFFEFRISKSEISFDTILTIKEFIDLGEEQSQTMLWDEQVKLLMKHIGG